MSEANKVNAWSDAVASKVRDHSHTIIACWSDWEHEAGFNAQVAQDSEPYFDAMYAQLDTVLLGLLDECAGDLLAACKAVQAIAHQLPNTLEDVKPIIDAAVAKAEGAGAA